MARTSYFEEQGQWFECDVAKSARNFQIRGFGFGVAALAYLDLHAVVGPNRVDDAGEQRYYVIGNTEGNILYVVFCLRSHNENQSVRIISARKANKKERSFYNEAGQGYAV